jgi:hypothetical protein
MAAFRKFRLIDAAVAALTAVKRFSKALAPTERRKYMAVRPREKAKTTDAIRVLGKTSDLQKSPLYLLNVLFILNSETVVEITMRAVTTGPEIRRWHIDRQQVPPGIRSQEAD